MNRLALIMLGPAATDRVATVAGLMDEAFGPQSTDTGAATFAAAVSVPELITLLRSRHQGVVAIGILRHEKAYPSAIVMMAGEIFRDKF